MGSLVYGFYDLKSRTCYDLFAPDRTEKILSGDDRAVFDVLLHGDSWFWVLGIGYWVLGTGYWVES